MSKPVVVFLHGFCFKFLPPVLALISLRDGLLKVKVEIYLFPFHFAVGSNHNDKNNIEQKFVLGEMECCTSGQDHVVWEKIVKAFGTKTTHTQLTLQSLM